MSSQHLSDEAVAAFADGVLRGHARERAARHVDGCAECRGAVRFQREAVLALRSAPVPSLPTGLFERLQALPATTPITTLPTAIDADGSTVLATFRGASPFAAAAFVPQQPDQKPAKHGRGTHRGHPFVTGAAVVALTAGALTAGAVSTPDSAPTTGETIHTVGSTTSTSGAARGTTITPVLVEAFVSHR